MAVSVINIVFTSAIHFSFLLFYYYSLRPFDITISTNLLNIQLIPTTQRICVDSDGDKDASSIRV